jgi:hypothetical protein
MDKKYMFDDLDIIDEAIAAELEDASEDVNIPNDNPYQKTAEEDAELDEAIAAELGVVEEDDEKDPRTDEDSSKESEEDIDGDIEDGREEDEDEESQIGTYTSSDILDILRQEQLLDIPEDFEGELTADQIDEFKYNTLVNRDREILESRRAMFMDDPYKLRVFDYLYFSDGQGNLPQFVSTVDHIRNYENFDISTDDAQKQILTDYLSDGLDPKNPLDARRLSKVNDEVQDILAHH